MQKQDSLNTKFNFVLPVFHPESKLEGQKVVDWVCENILRNPEKLLVCQNGPYDLSKLNQAGSMGARPILCLVDDSMVYHFLLDEHATNRKLDFLSKTYSKLPEYKDSVDVKNLENEDLKKVSKYNGVDAYAPREIIENLKEELKEDRSYSEEAFQYFRRLVPFISTIESVGFKVDRGRLIEKEIEIEEQTIELSLKLSKEMGGGNPESSKQLAHYLYDVLEFKVPNVKGSVGVSGVPSTREDIIDRLPEIQFIKDLKEFRSKKKLLSTYIRGKKGNSIWENLTEDDFVFPSFYHVKHQGGGSVSRISAKFPPVQTFPKEGGLKSCFISRYLGGCLAELDGNQMELRLGAVSSKDPNLIKIFGNKEDPHQATANLCGTDRDIGKGINFGIVYDITIKGLIEKFGLSRKKAQEVYDKTNIAFQVFLEYLSSVKRYAAREGRVSTPYGIWRRVPGANPSTNKGRALLREAANYVIQRPASDITQLLGWRIMHRLDGLALPVMTNHDGLTWDLEERNLEKVLDKMGECVVEFPKLVQDVLGLDLLGVPFEFDVKVGHNWEEMEKIKTF